MPLASKHSARFPSPPLPRHRVSAQFKGPGPYVHCIMISVSQQLSSAHTTNTQKITASEHLIFIPRDTHHAWRSQHHHHLTGCGEVGKGPYGSGKIASPTPCVAHFFLSLTVAPGSPGFVKGWLMWATPSHNSFYLMLSPNTTAAT